eukprot:EG_transcript_35082
MASVTQRFMERYEQLAGLEVRQRIVYHGTKAENLDSIRRKAHTCPVQATVSWRSGAEQQHRQRRHQHRQMRKAAPRTPGKKGRPTLSQTGPGLATPPSASRQIQRHC